KPLLRRQLQGGLLYVGLPCRRGCDRTVPEGSRRLPVERGQAAAGEERNHLRARGLRRRIARQPPLPDEEDEARDERSPAADARVVPARTIAHVSARTLEGNR